MIDLNWVKENPEQAAAKIDALIAALKPFAERPTKMMDSYICHYGIISKERCGRCSRAIAAYKAIGL